MDSGGQLIESLDFCVLGHGIGSYYQALYVPIFRRQVPEEHQYKSVETTVTTLPGLINALGFEILFNALNTEGAQQSKNISY